MFLITNVTAATITQYPENKLENNNSFCSKNSRNEFKN